MSTTASFQLGRLGAAEFTIKIVNRCRLVFGSVPISQFGMLTHGFSEKALIAGDIANRIGAAYVIGEPEDLEALRKMDLPVSEARQTDYLIATQLGLHNLAMWLRTGERGASSNAMSKRMFGIPSNADTRHPSDPDDLRRCMLFLEAAEAHDKITMMKDVSPEWSRLVDCWDELIATLSEEMAAGVRAQRTFELMRALTEN